MLALSRLNILQPMSLTPCSTCLEQRCYLEMRKTRVTVSEVFSLRLVKYVLNQNQLSNEAWRRGMGSRSLKELLYINICWIRLSIYRLANVSQITKFLRYARYSCPGYRINRGIINQFPIKTGNIRQSTYKRSQFRIRRSAR